MEEVALSVQRTGAHSVNNNFRCTAALAAQWPDGRVNVARHHFMDCVADWLATGVDAVDALESPHCGLHSYTTSIAARKARGQQSSHNFLANSSEFSRRWFISLTLDLTPVSASARFEEMLFRVKSE
jgi:hypothetical protein